MAAEYARPRAEFSELVEVMARLRDECPWDRSQTHRSLVTYLVEETGEVIDAIEAGTDDDLVEELGDLLLQVVFHSRIGEQGDVSTSTRSSVESSPSLWPVTPMCSPMRRFLRTSTPHGRLVRQRPKDVRPAWTGSPTPFQRGPQR